MSLSTRVLYMLSIALVTQRMLLAADPETWDGRIVQYGKMHEAIGQQQHQGRVQLKQLLERPHFFGVAALEKLQGEATFVDGKITITRVDAEGQLKSDESVPPDQEATLLVGAFVSSWTEHTVAADLGIDDFEKHIADEAAKAGLKLSEPFVFTIEGEFSNLRLHVINGACPMHARLRKIKLPKERQPVEIELEKVSGTVVGVFAKDAVGNITHPATSVHMHLVFKDSTSGKMVTGHVEQIGLLEGSVLRLPRLK
jgi:alpha-acetolactate decarboxylase